MNTIYWILILLILIFLLALVLPSKYSNPPAVQLQQAIERNKEEKQKQKSTCEKIGPCERPCRYNNLNQEKRKLARSTTSALASIASQFQAIKDAIPNDYPLTPIGCCPYGKPLSTDLPIPDIPVCSMSEYPDMRLHSSK